MSELHFEDGNGVILSFYKYDAMNKMLHVLKRKSGSMTQIDKRNIRALLDENISWDEKLVESIDKDADIVFFIC